MPNTAGSLFSATDLTECHSAASAIGNYLVSTAEWNGLRCSWRMPERPLQSRSVSDKGDYTGGDLYAGSPGIALFLTELASMESEARVRKTALGALRCALQKSEETPSLHLGFFSGAVGTLYALYHAALRLDDDWCWSMVHALVRKIADSPQALVPPHDLVGGAAGAIPPLLRLRERLKSPLLDSTIARLGQCLLETAIPESCGISWSSAAYSSRNLTGLAHGASGFANAMLEMFEHSGETSYWIGAMRALEYEATFMNKAARNWPDFRNVELWTKATRNDIEGLRELFSRPNSQLYQSQKFSIAWCHGAPGMGLVRLNAWERFGLEEFRQDALAAVDTTCDFVATRPRFDFGLCHGHFGNCELLRRARSRLTSTVTVDNAIRECVLQGVSSHGAAPESWPCGVVGERLDSGLMTGLSGIGLFLLACTQNADVEILLPRAKRRLEPPKRNDSSGAQFTSDMLSHFFPRTLAVYESCRRSLGELSSSKTWLAGPRRESQVLREARNALEERLKQCVAQSSETGRGVLEADIVSSRMMSPEIDGTENVFEEVRRQVFPANDHIPSSASITIRSGVRVIDAPHTDASAPEGSTEDQPPQRKWVFVKKGGAVVELRLQPFPSYLVQLASAGTTMGAIVSDVEKMFGEIDEPTDVQVQHLIENHVHSLYKALVIDLDSPHGDCRLEN